MDQLQELFNNFSVFQWVLVGLAGLLLWPYISSLFTDEKLVRNHFRWNPFSNHAHNLLLPLRQGGVSGVPKTVGFPFHLQKTFEDLLGKGGVHVKLTPCNRLKTF